MLPVMDFALDLLQGAGLAAAIGIRPLLPVLLAGVLASADAGLDFEGTDFSFLEQWEFLVPVAAFLIAFELVASRGRAAAAGQFVAIAAAVVLGALEAAGSLADRDHPAIVGLVVGAACAAFAFLAAGAIAGGALERLEDGAAPALAAYLAGVALLAAAASILFPPLALLVLAGLAWLLAGTRRRAGEKYAGLRILR